MRESVGDMAARTIRPRGPFGSRVALIVTTASSSPAGVMVQVLVALAMKNGTPLVGM
ncbi:MAG: hypothetical protein H0X35_15995 [Pseudonocardiales bacterium]|nr:hypothetical protein [Pseudonocardiales bacterium]